MTDPSGLRVYDDKQCNSFSVNSKFAVLIFSVTARQIYTNIFHMLPKTNWRIMPWFHPCQRHSMSQPRVSPPLSPSLISSNVQVTYLCPSLHNTWVLDAFCHITGKKLNLLLVVTPNILVSPHIELSMHYKHHFYNCITLLLICWSVPCQNYLYCCH